VTLDLDRPEPSLLGGGDDASRQRLVARAGWTLVLFGVLSAGLGAWGWWSTWPGDAVAEPVIAALALAAIAMLWMVRAPEAPWLSWSLMGFSAAALTFTQGITIDGRGYYSTDAAAFNDAAARLLRHGLNPYTNSLGPISARHLDDVADFWTYTLNGGHVSTISYPAGSFLFQVPLQLLGVHHLPTDWLDLFAAVVASVVLFGMLPRAIRWLSPALLLAGYYIGIFANGGTDALFMPFLLVAVWRWDRFDDPAQSRLARWSGPIALGLACTIKQTPWFCIPFLVCGVAIEAASVGREPLRAAGRYLALVVGAFAVPNLAFFIWSPGAWLHSVLLPLVDPLVPDGQGLVTLALHGAVRGAHVHDLAIAGLFAELALLVCFVLFYRHLKRTWLLLLPLTLMIPGRSLSEYLIDFLPAALVAATSVAATSFDLVPRLSVWWRRAIPAAFLVAMLGFAVAAFLAPVLSITVDTVTTNHNEQRYISMVVTLHNNTDHLVTPSIAVLENDTHPTGFWHLTSGDQLVLAPDQTRTVVLIAPPFTPTSLKGQYWIVEAVTPAPAAVSTSEPMQWHLGHP
jgi:uncharacterized membrane protein